MACNNVDLPPQPEQEKEFTVGWVKWLRKIYDAIKALQSCTTDLLTSINSNTDSITANTSSIATLESTVSTLGIKSIQMASASFTSSSATSFTITLSTAVNTANSIIIPAGVRSSYNTDFVFGAYSFTYEFGSTTTVLAKRGYNTVMSGVISVQVIEYCSVGCSGGGG